MILCHARRDPDIKDMQIASAGPRQFSVLCRPGWAEAFPQSAHLLREEVLAWQKTPWTVVLVGA